MQQISCHYLIFSLQSETLKPVCVSSSAREQICVVLTVTKPEQIAFVQSNVFRKHIMNNPYPVICVIFLPSGRDILDK